MSHGSYRPALSVAVDRRRRVPEDRLRREAARRTIRRQLLTSLTAPGRSTLGACTRIAHALTASRINRLRGNCTPTVEAQAVPNRCGAKAWHSLLRASHPLTFLRLKHGTVCGARFCLKSLHYFGANNDAAPPIAAVMASRRLDAPPWSDTTLNNSGRRASAAFSA